MKTLQQIRDEVAREYEFETWVDMSKYAPLRFSDEVSRRYATEVAKATLERAAENAKINASKVSGAVRIKSWALGHGIKLTPSRESILETPIELL
ncbi:hypothetical protein [Parapedobacter lycopersici]|uniref:hypothetical protein n=1 Tax=Parapedobacter lycopersici TaxID=1864939 RepID=UPI00214DDA1B|nr:hypothetical protein [Parapedobacter lycopersici]